jgi:hypothetical protein
VGSAGQREGRRGAGGRAGDGPRGPRGREERERAGKGRWAGFGPTGGRREKFLFPFLFLF